MIRLTCAALMLLAAPALGSAKEMKMHHAASAAAKPWEKAYKNTMDQMMTDMDAKPTGDADKDFVTVMLPHHQGAVAMAKVQLQYGKDPQLLAMARAIVDSQAAEIAEMEKWQAGHGK